MYNTAVRTDKSLAAVGFAKQTAERPSVLNTPGNAMDASEDPFNKSNKTVLDVKGREDAEVDPGIFEEIYAQLQEHAEYVKAIAKIFGKNIKYLFSKKKAEEAKDAGALQAAEAARAVDAEHEDDESEESDDEMAHVLETVEMKNAEDLKELARIQEEEEARFKDFMQSYVAEQTQKLEAFKDRLLVGTSVSEADREELLRQYEGQLQNMQKELLAEVKEQQAQLKIRTEARRNNRGQLATQLDKLKAQRRDIIRLIDNQLLSVDVGEQNAENQLRTRAAEERKQVEASVEARKADALQKLQANFSKRLDRTSDSRKRTQLLEEYERNAHEVAELFDKENAATLKELLDALERRVQTELEQLRSNSQGERTSLKTQKETQVAELKELESLIMNKLGNVTIDENLTEAIEADKTRAQEEEAKFESQRMDHQRKADELANDGAEKLRKLRDECSRDEDLIREDYEVQKRIIANEIKKKSEDLQKQKERHLKELKSSLLTEEEEAGINRQLKTLDEELTHRIEESVSQQEKEFQRKLQARRVECVQKEAVVKESQAATKLALDREWMEKEQATKTQIRKERLQRLLGELKTRTKGEELPIAAENAIESQHMEELTELLAKQYKEKAFLLSDKLGELIQNKLIKVHKVKANTEEQFQRLKASRDRDEISPYDYERRLRDIQSFETDRLREIELAYIQRQNELSRELCGALAQKQEEELVRLREEQWKERRAIIQLRLPLRALRQRAHRHPQLRRGVGQAAPAHPRPAAGLCGRPADLRGAPGLAADGPGEDHPARPVLGHLRCHEDRRPKPVRFPPLAAAIIQEASLDGSVPSP